MAIKIHLQRVISRQAHSVWAFFPRDGGGGLRVKSAVGQAVQHLVKVAPLDERRENTAPRPPAKWWELVRTAAQGQNKVNSVREHKRSFWAHCATYSKTRCQGLPNTVQESNKHSNSRVMRSKLHALREGEDLRLELVYAALRSDRVVAARSRSPD